MRVAIEKFTISLEAPLRIGEAVVERCGRLFHAMLKDDVGRIATETTRRHDGLHLDTLRLDLGVMQAWQFEDEFRNRFSQEFRRALLQHVGSRKFDMDMTERPSEEPTPHINRPRPVHAIGLSPSTHDIDDVKRCVTACVSERRPERAWSSIAPLCLRRSSRRYLLQWKNAQPLLQWLCGSAPLTELTLLLKALYWLKTQLVSRQSDANLFPRNDADAFVEHVVDAHIDKEALAIFSEPAGAALLRWQRLLWRDARVRRLLKHRLPTEVRRRLQQYSSHEPTGIVEEGQEQPAIPVFNAGIVLLWPLLPDLFRQLKLWDGKQFNSPDAQEQAAVWLDWLIWQDAPASAGRSDFTQRVCGLKPQEAPLRFEPAGDEQRSLLVEWLERLPLQLPGWRTLKPLDVRTLFLQRPGSLLIADTGAVLEVAAEPFDVLLQDWPWPLSVLVMPWLRDPLMIDWPIPRFDEWVPDHG
ncbi:contractile injection system tape measure protein [Paraburkholderia sp. SOS3]|uniref:contractile injection system tape measure protein n=1 Tax=Paraburkholderia sp. SOS3 TaxID=1926494 RepID=UPI0009474A67|nr:contractile injection system tape measure protein [Paraburkholderia sp. SOS3]APR38203.1 hypothetical protein BTO02_22045 [Paraburkholderia sp. SOS3]